MTKKTSWRGFVNYTLLALLLCAWIAFILTVDYWHWRFRWWAWGPQ